MHHIVPLRVYFTIFAALIVLTGTTVWAAFQDFGVMNDVVAMAIAITKATLVVLFFMHVRYSDRLTQLIVSTGILFLMILFVFTMADPLTRGWLPLPRP